MAKNLNTSVLKTYLSSWIKDDVMVSIFQIKMWLIGAVFLAIIVGRVALAEQPPVYQHIAVNEDLRTFLKDFLYHFGFRADISEKVRGVVSGRFTVFPEASAAYENSNASNSNGFRSNADIMHRFPFKRFNTISKQFGLVWYVFENTMYIYNLDEIESEMVPFESISISELKNSLKAVGIADSRYPIKYAEGQSFIYVSGPPKYVTLVKEVAGKVVSGKCGTSTPLETIRVFRLKYAWADDRTIRFRSEDIEIPGVATVLKNLLGVSDPGRMKTGKRLNKTDNTVPKLKGKGLSGAQPKSEKENSVGDKAQETSRFPGGVNVFIQADTRLNAVIIRDTEAKMSTYEKLISELDQPAGLVEIKVSIIDVNSDKVNEIGINWRNTNKWDNGGLKTGFRAPETVKGQDGFILGTIIGSASQRFLGAIRALAKDGQAEVHSRPSVLTLNNAEAIFEEARTAYVRVAGNQEVDLFDVTTGVLVKVTPHIIEKNKRHLIKMSIEIKDGTLSDVSVDGIPVVEQSTINTQAVVGQTESLLIGGMTNETRYKNERKIPLLGSIPLIGRIFKTSRNEKGKRERLFLITPRIIDAEMSGQTVPPLDTRKNEKQEQIPNDSGPIIEDNDDAESILVFDHDFTKQDGEVKKQKGKIRRTSSSGSTAY